MLIIGIAGGSGSGKTTVVNKITELLPPSAVSILSQDAYYFDNGHLTPEERARINFDHPSSIEFSLLTQHLDLLLQGENIPMPIYSYLTCARAKETVTIVPKKVIIVEGILIFTDTELRKRLDVKVFVDAAPDDRLMRIIQRDMIERGRSLQQALSHYGSFVKPMHEQFIEPTKRYADIIVPQGGENHVAISILTAQIRSKLGLG